MIVEPKTYTFADSQDKISLESGEKFGPVSVVYETYGNLNEERSNAILITHALTGEHHAAGRHCPDDKVPGWWDELIGPGKGFDTNKYFVICSNVLGGCQGTTGPSSFNPLTGQPYGMSFPVYTIRDMVLVQRHLVRHLGIEKLLCVAGGSMGGMQVMEWGVSFPDEVKAILPIATFGRMTAMGIGFNEIMRQIIMLDPDWQGGKYSIDRPPAMGLGIARMLGMITYRSDDSLAMRFDRRMNESRPDKYYSMDNRFEIESYLHYQGDKLVKRFDANTYIYLTKAMDLHDIGRERGGLEEALSRIKAKTLFVGVDSDWLYPPKYMLEMQEIMASLDKDVYYREINSVHGHDAFLIEFRQMEPLVRDFLQSLE